MTDQDLLKDAREYVAMLHRRRALVSTCVGVSLLLATLYNFTARPVYQASGQLLIDRDVPNVLPARELMTVEKGTDYYETQYELLRGRSLAEKVVERLQLQKNPELQTGRLVSPWERLKSALPWLADASRADREGMPLSPAVIAFRSRLKVEPVSNSRLVNLRFQAYDPALAARAVNTLAQLYVEQSLEFRYTTSTEATGWLEERVGEQQRKVEAAEKALQRYREAEGLLNVEERQGLADQKLTTLAMAVVNARTDRINREALHRQMQSSSQLGTFPLVMESTLIQGLKTRLSELRDEESRQSETLGDRHPELIRLRGRIKALDEKIAAETQNVMGSVESAYRTAQQQEASLQQDLEAAKREALVFNRKAIEYASLKREVESSRQLLQELMGRTKETGLETELKSTNLRVVEKAEVPRSPVLPRRLWNYQLALLLGLALGVGLSILFERMDNTIKTPEDVKSQLGLPFLGMIPEVPSREAAPSEDAPAPFVMRDPHSAVAEGYRVLRTNLIFTSAESTGRVLMVSSANPGEGKTTTVANLAASLAENGARVLAVEADLRRPTIHQHFGVPKGPGLSDLIVGKCAPTQVIQGTRLPRLSILPCGYIPPNPAELLGSDSMREIVGMLRKRYDWVLIDAPPILAMADTPVLCPFVDGVVLVVWAETCTRPAVERAVDQVTRVGGKITGVVLNKVNLERNSYYYSQYYGEYYRSYYAEGSAQQPGASAGGIRGS